MRRAGGAAVRVLAGDIGGTHARLALFEVDPSSEERPRPEREETLRSEELDGLPEAVRGFLDRVGAPPDAACLGIAGPVTGEVYRPPNLRWSFRREELAEALGIGELKIINDFDAVGHGLAYLREDELATLQEGRPRARAPIALIGAGTGLGTGYLTWHDGRYRVHSSEGGHVDFAPRDELGRQLQAWLADRHGRASCERVLSGPGLVSLYRFLRERGEIPERENVRRELEEGKAAERISAHAVARTDPLSVRALELFASHYGAQAGNLALTFQAEAGVYLAGGIAPAILPALRAGPFLEAFRAKGRLSSFMESIPVRVIRNTEVGLLGAVAAAVRP